MIEARTIDQVLDFNTLVDALQEGFQKPIHCPPRAHHQIGPITMLQMIAWDAEHIGIKNVSINKNDPTIATIQGSYQLFDAQSGSLLETMDAPTLTNWRTAATSALASKFLARKDSETLLIIGTGALAPYMAKAHCAVQPIKRILVWGRNQEKVESTCLAIGPRAGAQQDLPQAMAAADIVSACTSTSDPIINGTHIQNGTHIDLVGAYNKDMREADDQTIVKSTVFVDERATAIEASGDLFRPAEKGLFSNADIPADLHELCKGAQGRSHQNEITLFKSAGLAIEDLITAKLLYKLCK